MVAKATARDTRTVGKGLKVEADSKSVFFPLPPFTSQNKTKTKRKKKIHKKW